MAVVSVTQLWEGESAHDELKRKRDYTLMWEVLTDDPNDDGTVAGGPTARAMGLPGNGYPYPLDQYAYLISIDPQRSSESPTRWLVACKYSTELPRDQASQSQTFNPATGDSASNPSGAVDPITNRQPQPLENPLDRAPVYVVTHEKYTERPEFTWQGIPILNCADLPYDNPPIEIQRSRAVVTITKNYAIVKFDWLENFLDAVNNARWNGRNWRTCKIDAIDYSVKSENGVSFWQVVFRVTINPKTWDFFIMERGWKYKKNVAGTWTQTQIPIPVDTAGRAGDDVPLLDGAMATGYSYATDGSSPPAANSGSNPAIPGVSYRALADAGGALNDGTKGRGQVLAPGLSPIYTRWRIYPEKSFALLGL
jgi:hypothetical protein